MTRCTLSLIVSLLVSLIVATTTMAQDSGGETLRPNRQADVRLRQRQQTTTIASIGDAVMKTIDLALPDELYLGDLFWHQADELATDVVNYAMLFAC